MKKLSTYLFLILFSFSTPSFADDIRDFEIEGMSIGDSLLSFVDEEKIKKIKAITQYPNDKFIIYNASKSMNLKIYDYVNVATKKNDKNYIITNISGAIEYQKLDECLKLQEEIQNSIEGIFKSVDKQESNYASKQDKTGNSKVYGIQYYFKPYPSNESITVNCYHMTHESNINKTLKVAVNTEEYAYFLINEAYK